MKDNFIILFKIFLGEIQEIFFCFYKYDIIYLRKGVFMIELALRNVSKSYGINEILKDVSFEIRTNDVVGIVGENGAR